MGLFPDVAVARGFFRTRGDVGSQVCRCTIERVPQFNARLFLENKEQIGKVDVLRRQGKVRSSDGELSALKQGVDSLTYDIDGRRLIGIEGFSISIWEGFIHQLSTCLCSTAFGRG